jgi:hypothetical protein
MDLSPVLSEELLEAHKNQLWFYFLDIRWIALHIAEMISLVYDISNVNLSLFNDVFSVCVYPSSNGVKTIAMCREETRRTLIWPTIPQCLWTLQKKHEESPNIWSLVWDLNSWHHEYNPMYRNVL